MCSLQRIHCHCNQTWQTHQKCSSPTNRQLHISIAQNLISDAIDSISNFWLFLFSWEWELCASEFGKIWVCSHQKANIPNFKVYQLSKIYGLDIKWFDNSAYSFNNVKKFNMCLVSLSIPLSSFEIKLRFKSRPLTPRICCLCLLCLIYNYMDYTLLHICINIWKSEAEVVYI